MEDRSLPLVGVVLPPLTTRRNISRNALKSVLAQTYTRWEYTIVNNCSTDRTGEIAESYAAKDSRIRVVTNTSLLPAVANFNFALRQVSPESKILQWSGGRLDVPGMPGTNDRGDGENIQHRDVSSFGIEGSLVLWQGLPYPSECVSGREVCRKGCWAASTCLDHKPRFISRLTWCESRERFFNEF